MTSITSNPNLYLYSQSNRSLENVNLSDTSKYKVITVFDDDGSENFQICKDKLEEIVHSFSKIERVRAGQSTSTVCNRIIREEQKGLKDRELIVLVLSNRDSSEAEGFNTVPGWMKTQAVAEGCFSKKENDIKMSNKKLSSTLHEIKGRHEELENLKKKKEGATHARQSRLSTRIGDLEKEGIAKKQVFDKAIAKREVEKVEKVTSPITESTDLRLPVLNMAHFNDAELRPQFIKDLHNAMTTYGFFAVQNVGIDRQVIEDAYAQSEKFFNQDVEFKKKSLAPPQIKGQRGWVPGEIAKGAKVKDDKEFVHIGKEQVWPGNIWPDQPGFKESMSRMYNELEQYVHPLLEAVVEAINLNAPSGLKLPLSYLNDRMGQGENNLLRALYYPAVSQDKLNDPLKPHCWGAEHTDIDLITILPYATAKGLQVEVDGKWFNVVVPDDAFVVNIGDMLENMTNGKAKSAKHRIVAQTADEPRFSCVFFGHPKSNTNLEPLPSCIAQTGGKQSYAAGTRDEFLFERLLELGLAPGLLDWYSKSGHIFRQMEYGRESPQVLKMMRDKFFKPSTAEKV